MNNLFKIVFLLAITACDVLSQAPIQRNNLSTNVPGTPIIGSLIYSNAIVGGQTNFVVADSTGITAFQNGPPGAIWTLGAQGGSAAFTWGPGSFSSLSTNGAMTILVVSPNVIPARFIGTASQTANLLSIESNGVPVVTVGSSGNLQSSNGVYIAGMYRKQALLVTSTATTNQIDGTLQNSYRWTNMVTNIVLQLTNVVEGQEIDYWFTGSTNTGPNYTVLFSFPNGGSSLAFRWGDGITNGATSFTVTNNTRVAAFTKVWLETSMTNIEAYFRYLPK